MAGLPNNALRDYFGEMSKIKVTPLALDPDVRDRPIHQKGAISCPKLFTISLYTGAPTRKR